MVVVVLVVLVVFFVLLLSLLLLCLSFLFFLMLLLSSAFCGWIVVFVLVDGDVAPEKRGTNPPSANGTKQNQRTLTNQGRQNGSMTKRDDDETGL